MKQIALTLTAHIQAKIRFAVLLFGELIEAMGNFAWQATELLYIGMENYKPRLVVNAGFQLST